MNREFILINAAGVNRVTKNRFNAKSKLDTAPIPVWTAALREAAIVERRMAKLRSFLEVRR